MREDEKPEAEVWAEIDASITTLQGQVGHLHTPGALSVLAAFFRQYGQVLDRRALDAYMAERDQ